jgi:2-methylisocitrate lyase-like PEP mutase family enzyme
MSLTTWWMEATEMTEHTERARRFLALHQGEQPLLLPNPWDRGSAVLLAWLGFQALATTSNGFAATLGRPDGAVTREQALEHATQIPRRPTCRSLPTWRTASPTSRKVWPIQFGWPPRPGWPGARSGTSAAEAAHRGPVGLVLTARAENHLRGRPDLADTIDRLQAYQQAGADVLYAPGLTRLADIRQVVASVDRPVNVLARPGVPPVAKLAEVGVRRVSVGGGFAFAALGALVEAATELLEDGTYTFWDRAGLGSQTTRSAFPT